MSFTNFQVPYTIEPRYSKPVAYFSMEFAIHQPLKIYSGGLGFLAGSHLRSGYELGQNMVGIGILWKYGYYDQERNQDQTLEVSWNEKQYGFLEDTGIRYQINVHEHPVWVKVFYLNPQTFKSAPLFLLSTDVPENDYVSQTITHRLYVANVTEEEFEKCLLPVIKVRRFGKKEFMIRAGEVENYFNFIIKGLIRKYYRKGNQETNTQISMEGHIILSQESFHSRTPSEYFVETIEPSSVISIHHDDLEKVYAQSKKMEHLGRLVVTHTMVLKDRWQMQMVKMTPRERFLNFVMKNPELLQRVPQKHLASYLNIKPETFSRFKHLLKSNSRSAV